MKRVVPEPLAHGGRLDEAVAAHGGPRSAWLDLSTGINPARYPVPEVPAPLWHALPERSLEREVADAARAAYRAPDAAVSLAPGSQMHIQLLPFLFASQPVAVIGPTYGEHEAAWARAGHEVLAADGLATAEASARIVVVVNPNNPDGRIVDPALLRNLARRLASRGGVLVVDEAFADVTPDASVAPVAGRDGLVVLRSLGKFYGLAGARLGIALTTMPLAARLGDILGPWAVSGPALFAGRAALSDRVWTRRMRRTLAERRAALGASPASPAAPARRDRPLHPGEPRARGRLGRTVARAPHPRASLPPRPDAAALRHSRRATGGRPAGRGARQLVLSASPHIAVLAAALVLDRFVLPQRIWRVVPHPVVGFGWIIATWERHLFPARPRARLVSGGLLAAVLLLVAILLGQVARLAGPVYGGAVECVVVAILLAQRSLFEHVAAVADGLDRSIEDGRRAVSMIVGRDPAALDGGGVARAAIESLAENLSDGVVAPVLWYVVAGLPGILAYKAINTADSMIGHRTERHILFGRAAARLDDIANWVPARATALLIAAAARSAAALAVARADARLHRSPNAGWPEAAMAGALDVRLGGPRVYPGERVDEPFMNAGGRAVRGSADIRLALGLYRRALDLLLAVTLGIALIALVAWLGEGVAVPLVRDIF